MVKNLILLAGILSMINTDYSFLTGDYRFQIPGHSGWRGGDRLLIQSVSGSRIAGRLILDRDIGPEARMPMEWEKIYDIPFDETVRDHRIFLKAVTGEGQAGEIRYEMTLRLPADRKKPVLIQLNLIRGKDQKSVTRYDLEAIRQTAAEEN
jgi:hypothetical protein